MASALERAIALLRHHFRPSERRDDGWWTGPLLTHATLPVDERYMNVPPEAFPFLDSGRDGCHYALWIDDPRLDLTPPVVWVSPADGHPGTIRLEAANSAEFVERVTRAGLWPEYEGDADTARLSARRHRRRQVTHVTLDGMGVVCGPEALLERPLPVEALPSLGAGWTL
jgi:hypothetical protein